MINTNVFEHAAVAVKHEMLNDVRRLVGTKIMLFCEQLNGLKDVFDCFLTEGAQN
ncbi:MAG: hypothetical protein L0L75_08270 [Enterobacterales bacterium]|uniref:hypothetical protein n=1 Tax=Hafnia alvei TaxID=569 RepID=UPI0021F3CEAE|nr:hypothetical protein [Hafnia alvei]MCV9380230.1 hypothetical protein [Hafnia alvei]MDN6833719.1 hypothetical protein [Enterobacterales bacterium]